MKRVAMLLSALTLTIPVPVAASHIPDDQGLVQHCRDILVRFPQTNLGECVSQNHVYYNEAGGYASSLCDFYEENFPDDFYAEWENHGECVRELRDIV